MSIRTRVAAGLAMLCLIAGGCRSAMDCTDGCARPSGSPLAGMRYDCSCEGACCSCGAAPAPECGAAAASPTCAGDGSRNCHGGCRRPFFDRLCGCTGCGELYWCEWYNSPPELCQPCDDRGNYTGPSVDQYILPNASGRSGTPVGDSAPWIKVR